MTKSDYQRERDKAKLRADGSYPSLLLWGAVGLAVLAGGSVIFFTILGQIH